MPRTDTFEKVYNELANTGLEVSPGIFYNNLHNPKFFNIVYDELVKTGLTIPKDRFKEGMGIGDEVQYMYNNEGQKVTPEQFFNKTAPTTDKAPVFQSPNNISSNFGAQAINTPIPSKVKTVTPPKTGINAITDLSKFDNLPKKQDGSTFRLPTAQEWENISNEMPRQQWQEISDDVRISTDAYWQDVNNFLVDKDPPKDEYTIEQHKDNPYEKYKWEKSQLENNLNQINAAIAYNERQLNIQRESWDNKPQKDIDILDEMSSEYKIIEAQKTDYEQYQQVQLNKLKELQQEAQALSTNDPAKYEAELSRINAEAKVIQDEMNNKIEQINKSQIQFQDKYNNPIIDNILKLKQKQSELSTKAFQLIEKPEYTDIKAQQERFITEQKKSDISEQIREKYINGELTPEEINKYREDGTLQNHNAQAWLARTTGKLLSDILSLPRTGTGLFEGNYGWADKLAEWANRVNDNLVGNNPYSSNLNVKGIQETVQIGDFKVLLDDGIAVDVRDKNNFAVSDEKRKQILDVYDKSPDKYPASKEFNTNVMMKNALNTITDMGIMIAGSKGTGTILKAGTTGQKFITASAIFGQTHNDIYKQGIEAGLNPKDAARYATMVSTSVALVSYFNPMEYKLAGGSGNGIMSKILNASALSADDVALANTGKLTGFELAKKYTTGVIKNVVGENIEEQFLEPLAQDAISTLYEKQGNFEQQYNPSLEETVLVSLTTLPFGFAEVNSEMPTYHQEALMRTAENPEKYLELMEEKLYNDLISQQQFDSDVQNMQIIISTFNSISPDIDKNLREPLIGLIGKKQIIVDKIKQINDDVLSQKWKQSLEKVNADIKNIIDGKQPTNNFVEIPEQQPKEAVVVDPPNQDVKTDNEYKAFDFDGTLFDNKTGELTELGQQVKQRIADGEDIKIITARDNESIKQIEDSLGISSDNIYATGEESKKKETLTSLGLSTDEYYDADVEKLNNIRNKSTDLATVGKEDLTVEKETIQNLPPQEKERQKRIEALSGIKELLPVDVETSSRENLENSEGTTQPQEKDTVKLPPIREGGMDRNMVFSDGKWQMKVGGELTNVSEQVQKEANDIFIQNNKSLKEQPTDIVDGGDLEIKRQIEAFGVNKDDVAPVQNIISKVYDGLKKTGLTAAKTVGDWVGIGKVEANPNSSDGIVEEIQKTLPKVEKKGTVKEQPKTESEIPTWLAEFEKTKTENDLVKMEELYNKIKVVQNGVLQGRIKDPIVLEKTIKQLNDLKKQIEDYAENWKKENQPKVSSVTETDTKKQPINKIEDLQDVGEKIGGAKKDLAQKLSEVTTEDLATKPLSKVFPKPDFKKLVEEGSLSEDGAILLNFLYEKIPTKPRKQYRVANWVKTVDGALQTTRQVLEAERTKNLDFTDKILKAVTLSETLKRDYKLYSDTMKGLGFPKNDVNLGGYQIKMFVGKRLDLQTGKRDDFESEIYSIVSGSSIIGNFKTMDDAINGLKTILNKSEEKTKGTKFDIYQDRKTKEYFIGKKGAIDVVRVIQGFKTIGEARNFLKEKQSDLQGLWDAMKAPKERRMANRPRVGIDWRKGKNIDSKEFADTFGFRGVEFGNWVNNVERQSHVNEAYDALMDLSSVLGVSPKALSLNGELGFAFGARGSGKANAHYEAGKVVINLTKTRGAGSLAHEWWHAMDNYFSRNRGQKESFITQSPRDRIERDGSRNQGVRKEMIDAFKSVMDAIEGTKLSERSKVLDRARSDAYWSTNIEMSARSFENYIIEKLGERNQQNDYLANFKETAEWINDTKGDIDALKNYPYPLAEESPIVNEKFQQFFETIKEDEGGKLFKDAEAQYRIESGKNIIEAIRDFNKSKNKARATVALIHEIMHPTIVAIIDGAKDGNEVGLKHTETIVNEFNKVNPNNTVTVEDLIKGNDAFKNGTTSKQYRQVQEFIAKAWEKYHTEGSKGFSESFQKVLDQITKAFQSVYKSITGKELTPELRQMFEEILGKKDDVNPPNIDIDLSNLQKGEKRDKALIQRAELTFGKEAENELNEIGRKYTSDNWKEIEPRVDAYAKKVYGSSNFKEEVDNIINWIKNTTSGEYTDKKGLATAQTMLLNKLIMYSYNTDKESFKKLLAFSADRAKVFGQAIAAYSEASTPENLFNRAVVQIEGEKEVILDTIQPNGQTLRDMLLETLSKLTATAEQIDKAITSVENKGSTKQITQPKPKSTRPSPELVSKSKQIKEQARKKIDNAKNRLAEWLEKNATLGFAYDPKKEAEKTKELVSIVKDLILGYFEYGFANIYFIKDAINKRLGDKINIDDIWGLAYDEDVQNAERELQKEKLVSKILSTIKDPTTAKQKDVTTIIANALANKARKLSNKPKNRSAIANDVKALLQNEELAKEAWTEAMNKAIDAVNNDNALTLQQKMDKISIIEDAIANFTVVPSSISRKAIRDGLKDLNTSIKEIATEHYTKADDTKKTLIEKLISQLGISVDEATSYSEALAKEFDMMLSEKRKDILDNLLTNKKKPNRKQKTENRKILEAINAGALSGDDFINMFASKFGFNAITAEQANKLQTFIELINTANGEIKRQLAKEMGDYIDSLKSLDARGFSRLLQNVMVHHALSGLKTTFENIPIGSTLSTMFNLLPVIAKNPIVTMKFIKSYSNAGLNGTGIKAFASTMKTGYNDMDFFLAEEDIMKKGSRYYNFLNNIGWDNPTDAVMNLYKIPLHIAYFASAFDNIVNHRGGELLNFIEEYNIANKESGDVMTKVLNRMGYDKAETYAKQVDNEIEDMKDNNIKVPIGYKERRVKELMIEGRNKEIQQQAYETIKQFGLMGTPNSFYFSPIYHKIKQFGTIDEKSNAVLARFLFSITLGMFLRISVASAEMILNSMPILGIAFSAMKYDIKQPQGSKKRFATKEEFKKAAMLNVMTTSMALMAFAEMFDIDDDEIKLNPDRRIDISGYSVDFFESEQVRTNGESQKPMSIRFKNKDGSWSKWYEGGRFIPPLVSIFAIAGKMRDNLLIRETKDINLSGRNGGKKGELKEGEGIVKVSDLKNGLWWTLAGLQVASYNSIANFGGKVSDIVSYSNNNEQIEREKKIKDAKKLLFTTFFSRPTKTILEPNLFRDFVRTGESLTDATKTMDNIYRNSIREFYGIDHLLNHKQLDIFGNEVKQPFLFFDKEERYNNPEWKLFEDKNIVFDTPYIAKTATFDGEKHNLTNEQVLILNDKVSILFGNKVRENIEELKGMNQAELLLELNEYKNDVLKEIKDKPLQEALK